MEGFYNYDSRTGLTNYIPHRNNPASVSMTIKLIITTDRYTRASVNFK